MKEWVVTSSLTHLMLLRVSKVLYRRNSRTHTATADGWENNVGDGDCVYFCNDFLLIQNLVFSSLSSAGAQWNASQSNRQTRHVFLRTHGSRGSNVALICFKTKSMHKTMNTEYINYIVFLRKLNEQSYVCNVTTIPLNDTDTIRIPKPDYYIWITYSILVSLSVSCQYLYRKQAYVSWCKFLPTFIFRYIHTHSLYASRWWLI